MPTKILLADDHVMFREMLKNILHLKGLNYVVMAEAESAADTCHLVERYRPDLLLLDYKMPGLGRLSDFCNEVTRRNPATRILLLTGYSEQDIVTEAAMGGAHGYVVKGSSIADLLDAMESVNKGGIWVDPKLPEDVCQTFLRHRLESNSKLLKLSRQELKILALIAQGMRNKDIALRIHVSPKTVKNHITQILAKLGVANRQQASLLFLPGKKRVPTVKYGRVSSKGSVKAGP